MRTLTPRPKAPRQADRPVSALPGRARDVSDEDKTRAARPVLGHDFSRVAVASPARPGVRAKLMVNTPGDLYEQEADRVADAVMQEKGPNEKGIADEDEPFKELQLAEKCACEDDDRVGETVRVQRLEGPGADGRLETEIAAPIGEMRGDGRPLTSVERDFMEPRFGVDFGAIRVHSDEEADTHSRALHARAFTVGSDIFFRAGEYTPGTADGRRLLAHELTHTIQQGSARRTTSHLVQRQPAPPVVAPAPAPAGLASVNFLPVLKDLTPTGWGVTSEDDAVIDITAFASGGAWKCVITKADQQAHQGVRLLPGVKEVTAALVAAEGSCATLQTMITSLDTVANQGADSGFYMLSAVQAHEDLHITQYRGDLAPHYATLKATVEALSVPLAGSADAAAAKAAIKALPAFTTAIAKFHAGDVAANNKTAAHTLAATFSAIEHTVVDPMITTIKTRRTTLKCP